LRYVNNRDGQTYRNGVALKRRYLEEIFSGVKLGGTSLDPLLLPGDAGFPYWGDLGAKFAWHMESMPRIAVTKTLGASSADDRLQPLLATWAESAREAIDALHPLLTLARERTLPLAVFSLTEAMLEEELPAADAAAFLVNAAQRAGEDATPEWLWEVETDEALLDRLLAENAPPPSHQTLGAGQTLAKAAYHAATLIRKSAGSMATLVKDRGGDFVSTKLLASTRPALNATLGRFFGDIFCYFSRRGVRGDPGLIPQRIAAAFDSAEAAGGPLVVIAHSLGGVISYDLLSDLRPDITVDLFVTVGSQVSHFEEMKLYGSSDPAAKAGGPKAHVPDNINWWVNFYDPVDLFAYVCEPVFDRVTDVAYDTRTHTVNSHGAYFDQLGFYRLLRAYV